jgi:uncharacterized membrane protein
MRAPATKAGLLCALFAAGAALSPASAAAAPVVPKPGEVAQQACSALGEVPVAGGVLEGGCEAITAPFKLAEWLVSKGWGALNAVLGDVPKKLAGAVQKVISDGANAVLDGISGWIASGAVWAVSQVAKLIQATTTPHVKEGWFAGEYGLMERIALALALPLLMFAIGRALFLREPAELVRSVLVYLPLAAILTAGAVAATQMALAITDSLSGAASAAVGASAHQFFSGATKGLIVLGAGGAELPGFVVAIVAVFAAFAAFILWIELILRSAAIYVVLLFLPLAFVAMVWPSTARFARRMVEALAAIILAKLVIVAIISLAASGMVHAGLGSNVDAALAGVALMGLAIFAPWTLLRMLPMMEAAVAHHEGASRYARAAVVDRASEQVRRAFAQANEQGAQGAGSGTGASGVAGADAGSAQAIGGVGAGADAGAASGAGAAGAVGAGAGGAGLLMVAGAAAHQAVSRARMGGSAAGAATSQSAAAREEGSVPQGAAGAGEQHDVSTVSGQGSADGAKSTASELATAGGRSEAASGAGRAAGAPRQAAAEQGEGAHPAASTGLGLGEQGEAGADVSSASARAPAPAPAPPPVTANEAPLEERPAGARPAPAVAHGQVAAWPEPAPPTQVRRPAAREKRVGAQAEAPRKEGPPGREARTRTDPEQLIDAQEIERDG